MPGFQVLHMKRTTDLQSWQRAHYRGEKQHRIPAIVDCRTDIGQLPDTKWRT